VRKASYWRKCECSNLYIVEATVGPIRLILYLLCCSNMIASKIIDFTLIFYKFKSLDYRPVFVTVEQKKTETVIVTYIVFFLVFFQEVC